MQRLSQETFCFMPLCTLLLSWQYICEGAFRWNWCFKKSGKQAIGRSRGGLTTKIPMVTASDRSAVSLSLSSGAKHDLPEGKKLVMFMPTSSARQSLLMDRAYEGDKMRSTAERLGYKPVVPPKKIVLIHGYTTRNSTKEEMKSNDFSGESNGFAVSSHVIISLK